MSDYHLIPTERRAKVEAPKEYVRPCIWGFRSMA